MTAVPAKTVVFTDIEGSTQLLRVLGDRFGSVLLRHRALVREAVLGSGGIEAGTEGDGFFALFDRPADAVLACVRAQRSLADEPWPAEGAVRVRMGIHLGEVRGDGDDYVGLGIHQAARVAPAAHGGQVIVSPAIAAAVGHALPEGAGLLDLGAFHLRDFDGPQHLFQVLHPDLERSFPPPRVASAAVHNLAPARTSFVGRSDVLEELVKRTEVAQLVTIVGPGGVGKTRLASEVGLRVADRYPAGVWLVALASAGGNDDVAEQVKAAMGLTDRPGRTATQVIAARLAEGAGLVILDNCEHVLDGCVQLVEELLDSSATVRVLATSREHLGMAGEEEFRLDPLDLPGPGARGVEGSGAVELFVARAAQARRGFTLTEDNGALVASVCARLDGIPLCLELAAARLSTMSIGQLHQRLDDSLGALESGRRGGVDRQRTLRAALDWSHRLLHPDDQQVFRALSVFRGGFTLDAATVILGGDAGVERGVEHLVAQSLVEFEPAAEPPRYRLLETIRAYATARLADPTDPGGAEHAAVLADRHAAFYAALAHECAEEGDSVPGLDRMAADHPNLLAAVDHLASGGLTTRHGQLLVDLASFWDVRGHWQLSRQQFLAYLERADRDRVSEGHLLRRLGVIGMRRADLAGARDNFVEALSIAREIGDRQLEGSCVGNLGAVSLHLGDLASARDSFTDALGIARELGDRRLESTYIGNLGAVERSMGDLPAARGRYEEALGIARDLGNRRSEGLWLGNLGVLARSMGDFGAARDRYEAALVIARELGDRLAEAAAVSNLGAVALHQQDLPLARDRYEEALAIARELGDRSSEGRWLTSLGTVAKDLGDLPSARARYEQALEVLSTGGDRAAVGLAHGSLGEVALGLGEPDVALASFEQARTIARELGDPRREGLLVGYVGLAAHELGDGPRARVLFGEALVTARELGNARHESAWLRGLADVAVDGGEHGQACLSLAAALRIGRELDEDSNELLVSCARLLARTDRCADAVELLAAAGPHASTTRSLGEQRRYDETEALCRRRLDELAFTWAWSRGEGRSAAAAAGSALQHLEALQADLPT